ncbi:hypothetical protein E2C01_093969 [Portunus trituberculatus]|uniref:Uncharacterized protein n=1 Tax=Portunus trituberculatus TaxID=210409 RepID=A0A5B7JVP4_PORTR|nr:hypothetical protein [Portunus trituberculatus]
MTCRDSRLSRTPFPNTIPTISSTTTTPRVMPSLLHHLHHQHRALHDLPRGQHPSTCRQWPVNQGVRVGAVMADEIAWEEET